MMSFSELFQVQAGRLQFKTPAFGLSLFPL